MRNETALFFRFIEAGLILVMAYRLSFIARYWFRKYKVINAILEAGYWITAGIWLFAMMFRYNSGQLRMFLFLGLTSGAFFANYLLKRLIFLGKRCNILSCERMKSCFLGFRRSRQFEKVKKKKK